MNPPLETKIVSEFAVQAVKWHLEWMPALRVSRLLLGHAVERTQTHDEVAACNTDHFAVRKQTRQRIQRHAIIRIIEGWHDHDFVGDIKIRVTRGKPVSIEING